MTHCDHLRVGGHEVYSPVHTAFILGQCNRHQCIPTSAISDLSSLSVYQALTCLIRDRLLKTPLIIRAPAEIALLPPLHPRLPQTAAPSLCVTGSSSTPSHPSSPCLPPCLRRHPRPSPSPDRTHSPGWGRFCISTAVDRLIISTPSSLMAIGDGIPGTGRQGTLHRPGNTLDGAEWAS